MSAAPASWSMAYSSLCNAVCNAEMSSSPPRWQLLYWRFMLAVKYRRATGHPGSSHGRKTMGRLMVVVYFDTPASKFCEVFRTRPLVESKCPPAGVACSSVHLFRSCRFVTILLSGILARGLRNYILDSRPTYAYDDRGTAWRKKGEYDKALADYNQALRLDPNCVDVRSHVAWLQATCPDKKYRDAKKAVENASKVCQWSEGRRWDCFRCARRGVCRERRL